MADDTPPVIESDLPHILLQGYADTHRYQALGGGSKRQVPLQNRATHGKSLQNQIAELKRTAAAGAVVHPPDLGIEDGIVVEFVAFPGVDLAFESLAREKSGIELLNVREQDQSTHATVFIPEGKLEHFERLVRDYLAEKKDKRGYAIDNRPLLDAIREIRAATMKSLWTDVQELFPDNDRDALWLEVWLPVRGAREQIVQAFRTLAQAQGIRIRDGSLHFPERTILLAFGSPEQFKRSILLLNLIAELRRAKETADFFDSLAADEQAEWAEELLARTTIVEAGGNPPYVCLLDTGINNGHMLIAPALDENDLHTVDPDWGVADEQGHGTEMAGLALFGNLTDALAEDYPIALDHRLESVKLLRTEHGNEGAPEFHGYLTVEAVSRPEVTAPQRTRVYGLAITSRDGRDRGNPSAWSGAIDRLASDAEGEGEHRRLIVVSAGNIDDLQAIAEYPTSNTSDSIHDPGQAWNALTVGAFTELINITEPDTEEYHPIASLGGLSPYSTTSMTWAPERPLKPDVVFEGGNAGRDALSAAWLPSLSLLSTHYLPFERLFTTTRATSAAMALGARMCAQVIASYPTLWPETIRGLIVHSARWTDEMRRMYLPQNRNPTKAELAGLIRHCGMGVPNLNRALWSASNSLVLISEEALRPYMRKDSGDLVSRDMHLYDLPWPREQLQALHDAIVRMRVTLSYFVEPNPSNRGRGRYRYPSHGLRFAVKRPDESVGDFQARINRFARSEEEESSFGGEDEDWQIGSQNRTKGSIHNDIWEGTAADLASCGVLAVYPTLGWWKTRKGLGQWNRSARYSLIVSIEAPELEVDLYAAIATQIAAAIETEV